jgi:exonuclease SbcD
MKFAHLADVHIGAWRDPLMKSLSIEAFEAAVSRILELNVDFVLIAGDLFHTAMPAIDHLKQTVSLLKKLRNNDIPVYIIPGSHDFSISGKTFLDVLEEADLMINVMKTNYKEGNLFLDFTVDDKGAKITGIGGKRAGLEKKDFEILDKKNLELEEGFKIFMFHTSIDQLKPSHLEMMEGMSVSLLPCGFDYYAGGHVHIVERKDFDNHKNVVYPGPLFPDTFSELWKLKTGGFYIYNDGEVSFQRIFLKDIVCIEVDANGLSSEQTSEEIVNKISSDVNDKIVLLRIRGVLESGKVSDIDFRTFISNCYSNKAYYVMRNTSKLSSKEFNLMQAPNGTADEIEEEILSSSLSDQNVSFDQLEVYKKLFTVFSNSQLEGEKKYEYEERIIKDADKIFDF